MTGKFGASPMLTVACIQRQCRGHSEPVIQFMSHLAEGAGKQRLVLLEETNEW